MTHSSDERARRGIDVFAICDRAIPERLRQLSDAPGIIYSRGGHELLAGERLVAIVGTRDPSPAGERAAASVASAFSDAGWAIVSGLAPGIDTAAHAAAVARRAPTIAVVGTGLDRLDSPASELLADRIVAAGGVLISEQPPEEPSRARHRIARDRLQSGLSVAVIVVESELRGGAMHTARFAAAQGRPILCPLADGGQGVRALLERPARELCSVVPAWRGADELCARLGDRPLGRQVAIDRLVDAVAALAGEAAIEA